MGALRSKHLKSGWELTQLNSITLIEIPAVTPQNPLREHMTSKYTKQQVELACEIFNVPYDQVILLRDGLLVKGGKVWWRSEDGPEHVKSEDDWDNIVECPDVYQMKEPKIKIVYEENT
jgi:hypothetical protein